MAVRAAQDGERMAAFRCLRVRPRKRGKETARVCESRIANDSPHPRLALRAGSAVRFGILPSQCESRLSMHILAALFAMLWLAALPARGATPPPSFAVIVADDINENTLSRETLSFIFQRKQSFWRSGRRIQPVNLPAANPLRRAFSACIFGREPVAMEDYWREQYYHGVLPPHVLESEEAVALFVGATPGAIGYVSSCPPGLRAKVVLTAGDPPNCPHRNTTCL
jgi:hypothetical protein